MSDPHPARGAPGASPPGGDTANPSCCAGPGPGFVRKFNVSCAVLALLAIAAPVSVSLVRNPKKADFGQFYMGGVVARHGAWSDMYPLPIEGRTHNAGSRRDSKMRPGYKQLADAQGVGDVNRFMQPPPASLLLSPLALWDYDRAHWVYSGVMVLCSWVLALMAGHFHAIARGRRTWVSGAVTMLVALSPLLYRTIRESQVSPVVAVSIGLATMAWLPRRPGGPAPRRGTTAIVVAALSILVGSLLKYAPAVLGVLILITRRWKLLGWLLGLGVAALVGSILIMGTGPYEVFITQIGSTLGRSFKERGNQCLTGMLLRLGEREVLTPVEASTLRVVSIVVFAGVVALLFRARRAIAQSPPHAMAGAVALLAWLLLFGPIAWEHYFTYLCPFWGWLVWEAGQSRWRAVVAWSAIGLTWMPWAVVPRLELPEPLVSHMMGGLFIMFGLALLRLRVAEKSDGFGSGAADQNAARRSPV